MWLLKAGVVMLLLKSQVTGSSTVLSRNDHSEPGDTDSNINNNVSKSKVN